MASFRSKARRHEQSAGYRYAHEREAYMDLTPEGRQHAKKIMEDIWNGKGVTACKKAQWPCPRVEETED